MLEFVAASVFGFWIADRRPEQCPSNPVTVSVSETLPEATVSHAHTRRSLVSMMGNVPFKNYLMQGLAKIEFQTSFTTSITLSELADGRWCASPDMISVNFGFRSNPEIFIASEIEKGSCVYDAVLEHEREHVEIGHRAVLEGKQLIQAGLQSVIEAGPVKAATRTEAGERAKERVAKVVDRQSNVAVMLAERRHAEIDTPESYQALRDLCP